MWAQMLVRVLKGKRMACRDHMPLRERENKRQRKNRTGERRLRAVLAPTNGGAGGAGGSQNGMAASRGGDGRWQRGQSGTAATGAVALW